MLYVVFGFGCALTRAPELNVSDAAWGEAGEMAQELLFEVVLRNPTAPREATTASDIGGALRLLEVHYEVSLDGQRVYHGRRDARATLGAGGERTLTLPAVVETDNELSAFIPRSDQDPTARYRISGHVRYLTADRLSEILADLGWPQRRARFSAEGQLSATK